MDPRRHVPWLLGASLAAACERAPAPGGGPASAGPVVPATGLALAGTAAPASLRAARPAPSVDLRGRAHPPPPEDPLLPRVHALAFRAWIHEEPQAGAARIGYLRVGASALVRGPVVSGGGCPGGWAPIEPRGFVCLGRDATADPAHPVVVALGGTPPVIERRLPYIYGTVRRPGPVYSRLPDDAELARAEPDLEERMKAWLSAEGEIGASYAQHVWLGVPGEPPDARGAWETRRSEGVPPFLEGGAAPPGLGGKPRDTELVLGRMKPKVGYSLLRTFLHRGRRYGLTAALELVPTDRLRPIQGSEFRGFEIGKDVEFPFAIVRREGARFHAVKGAALVEGPLAPYRSAHSLTGKQRFHQGRLHFETRAGLWLSDRDASRLDPIRRMPRWGKDGERWIDVNLTRQTLMLVDGTREVYATLISSGEAGLEDPAHTTATKRGIFRVHTKHLTATMASAEIGEEFELRDVPYVQYFDKEGYALHGAYWHDRFGTPKSHGCINLSPEDARRVFFFTKPELPAGWHGVVQARTGTVLFVHP